MLGSAFIWVLPQITSLYEKRRNGNNTNNVIELRIVLLSYEKWIELRKVGLSCGMAVCNSEA
jgi:hypothetical protein